VLQGGRKAALIVIENKIDAPEGKGQLEEYKKKAEAWCLEHRPKGLGSARMLLIFLTPDKRHARNAQDQQPSASSWITLSHLELASALRLVWLKETSAGGREWLRLYIAAILQGPLGLNIDQLGLGDIQEYVDM
jgi:hypothetical protein